MKLLVWGIAFNLFLGSTVSLAEPNFSEAAWRDIAPIYAAIARHPFNRELARGTLSRERFARYSDQDALYLVDFARALGVLATKLESPVDARAVLKLAIDCLDERKPHASGSAPEMAPATFAYVNYLLATAAQGNREELAAALLPCFWIYLRLANDLKADSVSGNPFASWIESYSSNRYRDTVQVMIDLVDGLAARATAVQRSQMQRAFRRASQLEWMFWEGAYRGETWVGETKRPG